MWRCRTWLRRLSACQVSESLPHFIIIIIINYIIVLVEAVFVAPRSEELDIAT